MSCFYHRVLIVAAKCELVYVYEICCETAIMLRVRLLCKKLKIATKKPPKQRVEIAISLGIRYSLIISIKAHCVVCTNFR